MKKETHINEILIRLDNLKRGIELLNQHKIQRLEFNVEIKNVGKFKGKMYKEPPDGFLISLERVD